MNDLRPTLRTFVVNRLEIVAIFLIFCGIALIPFNAISIIPPFFGELSGEGAFYPMAFAVVLTFLCCIMAGQCQIPGHISFILCAVFLVWTTISSLFNWTGIAVSFNKGRTGQEKLFLQMLVYLFGFATAWAVYHLAIRRQTLKVFRIFVKAVVISVIIAGIYSVIEIAYLYGSSGATDFLVKTNSLFRQDCLLFANRLRSVCGEPSWFGNYIAFVYPWLLYLYFSCSRSRLLIVMPFLGYILFMSYLSFSRSVFCIIGCETLLYFFMLALKQGFPSTIKRFMALVCICGVIVIFVIYVPLPNSTHNAELKQVYSLPKSAQNTEYSSHVLTNPMKAQDVVVSLFQPTKMYTLSNTGRLGSVVTGLRIGTDHPIFGIGLGQYGFYMSKYVPDWASNSAEVQNWMSHEPGTFWPPVLNIYVRIFAELGIIGLLLWLSVWCTLMFTICRILIQDRKLLDLDGRLGIALLVTIAGCVAVGFNFDSFRLPQYWILLAMSWVWLKAVKCKNA